MRYWTRLARILSAALALAVIPALAQSANEKNINDIGHRGVGDGIDFYSVEKEIALGKMLSQQVQATSRMVDDPVINEYVNRLAQNLVRNSDAHVPFTVKIIQDPTINAMALPGGFFFVNSGLMMASDDEAEMAGVMAHEISHVAARHVTRNMTKAELANYLTFPLIFVGGPIGLLGRTAGNFAVPMTFLKFSRGAEKEADYLGVQYMYKTGYDPQAMISMFEKINALNKKKPGTMAKAFSTHPPTPDRIAATEKEIATILPPRSEYIEDTSEFDQIKARLARVLQQNQMEDKLNGSGRPSLRRSQQGGNTRPVLQRRPEDQQQNWR